VWKQLSEAIKQKSEIYFLRKADEIQKFIQKYQVDLKSISEKHGYDKNKMKLKPAIKSIKLQTKPVTEQID
jgi:hypothetical protein